MSGNGIRPAAVTLLSNGELDTLALGQRDPWLLLANDDDVGLTSGELVVNSILQVDNVEATVVTLTMVDNTNTTHVATTSDHDDHTSVEGDEVRDLASAEVDLDCVVDLDSRVGVTDCSRIVRNQVGNSALAQLDALDLAELVLCLLVGYSVDGEAALGVVDETEVLARLLNGDDVHQSRGECGVGADLAVNLDETLHKNGIDLACVERILQPVTEEDDER